jgi:leader peptidase (prepilin peptidase)/N-methyltransferase
MVFGSFFFICGCLMGSFLNCASYRCVRRSDWIRGRSCCDHCGHTLASFDLIPLLSFMFSGGRCRYCGERISFRYPLIEALTGILFLLVYRHYEGICAFLFRDLILFSILITASLIDLETYVLPDALTLIGAGIWLLSVPFADDRILYLYEGCFAALFLSLLVYILYLLFYGVCKEEGMGMGDVKLLFMLGLYSGTYRGLMILFCASLLGSVYMLLRKKRMIAFGPFLSLAFFMVMILF